VTATIDRIVGGLAIALVALSAAACSAAVQSPPAGPGPIDSRATPETRALFLNLRQQARAHVMFGHQDDLAYGHDWIAQPGRSDVKDVSGSYPALYGWELGGLETGSPRNIDGVDFDRMRGWIAEGYRRGGVITASWHVDNPLTGKNAWDTTSAIVAVLPGGAKHEAFTRSLDRLAAFLGSLRGPGRSGGSSDTPIPVILRPWHEMSGGWFWWGLPHTKGDEFQQLWRFTVTYLRDVKGLHNLIYAYAPNSGGSPGTGPYMNGYPGDDYVDVLGFDSYFPGGPARAEQLVGLTRDLSWIVRQAESRGKIPAFTETGLNALRDTTFWTARLAAAIEADSLSRRIAYVMVWRNANRASRTDEHYYAPYPGQPSAGDFRRFKADPLFLFEDALPDLYRAPGPR
jgi:mannan endo-1,4-beta-mannosidase